MSRFLRATIDASGKVLYQGVEIKDVLILSEGKGESEGLLLIDKDFIAYLTSNAQDTKVLIEKILGLIEQLAQALDLIDNKPAPAATVSPIPVATANIAQINLIKGELDLLKDSLK